MAQLAEIIYDEKVLPAIIDVIDGAKEYLVLVSPYNKYSTNLSHALERAAKRKVRITAVCRKDQEKDERAHLEWLRADLGAKLHLVERLHAKIYFNESAGIVTSMNLHDSSATNSKEIGFSIDDATTLRQVEDYVLGRLVEHSKPAETPRDTSKPKTPVARPPKAESKLAPTRGLCIRCGKEEIPYNPDAPLCRECYGKWKVHGNRAYPEHYCHRCRKKRKTSFARPLCKPCYEKAASAT